MSFQARVASTWMAADPGPALDAPPPQAIEPRASAARAIGAKRDKRELSNRLAPAFMRPSFGREVGAPPPGDGCARFKLSRRCESDDQTGAQITFVEKPEAG